VLPDYFMNLHHPYGNMKIILVRYLLLLLCHLDILPRGNPLTFLWEHKNDRSQHIDPVKVFCHNSEHHSRGKEYFIQKVAWFTIAVTVGLNRREAIGYSGEALEGNIERIEPIRKPD